MSRTVKKNALKIIHRLRESGFKAYIVGGAVRDMVMGREPEDYDIATDASPEDIARLFKKIVPVGSQFGVSMVILSGKSYEVSQFRIDGEYEDSRRPARIEPADEFEDVCRRDFTINALLYDPVQDSIIDIVGGQDDIRKHIIRTVGDPRERFAEDRLRMLRAVRFAVRFDFDIDPETFKALQHQAPHILDISYERIGLELSKMFTGNHPERALCLLDETGLLEAIMPEVTAMKGVRQPVQFHPEGDVFEHTLYMLELFGGGSLTLAFGILLHDVGKPVTFTEKDRIRFNQHDSIGAEIASQILRRLRFSNEIIYRVRMLVKNHMRFVHARNMKRSTMRRFMAMDGFDELLELFRLDCLASHKSLDIYEDVKERFEQEIKLSTSAALPEPLLDGHNLILLGYEPGPLFSTMLRMVMDAQLEGTVSTRDEAVTLVMKNFPLKGVRKNQKRKSSQPD